MPRAEPIHIGVKRYQSESAEEKRRERDRECVCVCAICLPYKSFTKRFRN